MTFRAVIPLPSRLATRAIAGPFRDTIDEARDAGFALAAAETPDSDRMHIADAREQVRELWVKHDFVWVRFAQLAGTE